MSNETDPCANSISAIDAVLYGLPAGLVIAALLLICFVAFGKAITARKIRKNNVSASSVTRNEDLGKKKKRGPPPSSDLRPVDINSIARSEDAPDDIKAMLIKSNLMNKSKMSKT